ncbi:hypothetical protein K474DRAFT_1704684 [Panus rudis PR-1116 ss-1]|nr:hypothetical protein K474DRAFT_1704684 [Panus rudis PR-1116 ss-1]
MSSESEHQSPSPAPEQHPEPAKENARDAAKPPETADAEKSPAPEGSPQAENKTPEAESEPSSSRGQSQVPSAGDWQAIWSPAHNAYYFYNAVTQETTWTNPLQPAAAAAVSSPTSPASTSASPDPSASTTTPAPSSAASHLYQLQMAAAAQGIDPSLAYLDPSLVAGPSSSGSAFEFTAKFNARTGAFAKADARDPSHLSEYERAKRMSEFYFDVNAWEQDVAKRKREEEEESRKKKKLTKKDIERFKEQKRQKKLAKTAWLRT